MLTKEPTLQLNHESGRYEGYLRVQVDAELFRRLIVRELEQDEMADLTNPNTWVRVVEKIGKITRWLDNPHTSITPVSMPIASPPEPVQAMPEPIKADGIQIPSTQKAHHTNRHDAPSKAFETSLRKRACRVPPSQWDTLLTPLPTSDLPRNGVEKKRIYHKRGEEKRMLKILRQEVEAGTFHLDADAATQEQAYQNSMDNHLTTKIETVAMAVNGSRIQ